MSTYITIGDDTYATDTDEEITEAKAALREAGLESAKVFAGEPDGAGDSYTNGQVLFADQYAIEELTGGGWRLEASCDRYDTRDAAERALRYLRSEYPSDEYRVVSTSVQ